MSLPSWIVGIDDTDMPDVGGTGRLARRMAAEIEALGVGHCSGVTRHQFYEGEGVPKTARNSAAAAVIHSEVPIATLFNLICDIVDRDSIAGSDPGVAIGSPAVDGLLVGFARRAQNGLVDQQEARRLGSSCGVRLAGLGGTEDGVIGALGAMALRADGNDGRFVDLPGIRDVSGVLTVTGLKDSTGVVDVIAVDGSGPLSGPTRIDIGDWLRPRLVDGSPVLAVRRLGEGWVNADRRNT